MSSKPYPFLRHVVPFFLLAPGCDPNVDAFGGASAGGADGGSGGEGSGASAGNPGTGGSGAAGGDGIPVTCGDGVVDSGEECDGDESIQTDCLAFGYSTTGSVSCSASCSFDLSACGSTCDGALLEPGEECDGTDFGSASCLDFGYASEDGLVCESCALSAVGCSAECGNGVLEPGEGCDGSDVGSLSCFDFGYASAGVLACAGDCQSFNLDGCAPSCNGVLEPGEDCDGEELSGMTCQDFGYSDSAGLACDSCEFDTTDCQGTCGNSVTEPDEQCDDGNTSSNDGCSNKCELEGTTCSKTIPVTLELGSVTLYGTTDGGGAHSTSKCSYSAGSDRIYSITPQSNGFLTASLSRSGTTFDSVLYARTSCSDGGSTTVCADSFNGEDGDNGGEVVSFPAAAGTTYYIVVDGISTSNEGPYELTLDLSTGDDCSDPVPIPVSSGTAMALFGLTVGVSNSAYASCGGASAPDVVYAFTPTFSGEMNFAFHNTYTSFDTVLYAQSSCGAGELACEDDGGNGGESLTQLTATAGVPVYAWVDGSEGAQGVYGIWVGSE